MVDMQFTMQCCFHIDSATRLHVYHAAGKLHVLLCLFAAQAVVSGQHKKDMLLCVLNLKSGHCTGPTPTMTVSVGVDFNHVIIP